MNVTQSKLFAHEDLYRLNLSFFFFFEMEHLHSEEFVLMCYKYSCASLMVREQPENLGKLDNSFGKTFSNVCLVL